MKSIGFGSDLGARPTGSWDKLGLTNGVTKGEFKDLFNYSGSDYLVSVVKGAFSNSEYIEGDIMVSRVIADLYKDGSGNIFLDSEKSYECDMFEKLLNSDRGKEMIARGLSIRDVCDGYLPAASYNLLTSGNEFLILGINHKVFEQKKHALDHCHSSISSLMEEINNLYDKVRTLEEKENSHGHSL